MTRRRWIVTGVIATVLLTGIGAWLWWLLHDLPAIETLDDGLITPSITLTDRHGRALYEVIGDQPGRNRVVPLDEVPGACIDATLATEDARYYSHPGFDLLALGRAVWVSARGGDLTGASTITQQVVRNLLLAPDESTERTFRRKLREIVLAYRLERRFSKDEILALYLNQTYYGNLAYGIDAAARAYFGVAVGDLSVAQCALLAGLPQAPALYDPLTDAVAASARQEVVLGLMLERGWITRETHDTALNEPLVYAGERYSIEAPHFVFMAYEDVINRLPADVIAGGGLTVRTTLDLDWQHTAESIIRMQIERLNTPTADEPSHNVENAALVSMDPHTGQVLALVGSPDYTNPAISGAINLAVSPRQPGSTLKPFTYALAFDPAAPDPWAPATMLLDVETSFITADGFVYTPLNYDRREHGPVTIREALASSYNIPAVLALDHVGVTALIELLGSLGVDTVPDPGDVDLALTLGGGEVRLIDLAAAYAALANGGTAVNPVLVLEVVDESGEVLYAAADGLGGRVLDERVAWLLTDILSDNNARAPAFGPNSLLQIGRPAAVKTGTTTDFRDNWTLGYTPNLVTGVWVGNTSGQRMIDVSGISGAGPIWHTFMRTVLDGQAELAFERPPGLTRVEVCSPSGMLPSPDCPYTRLDWFITGHEPSEEDALYHAVTDPRSGRDVLALDLPPIAADWAAGAGVVLLSDVPADPSKNATPAAVELALLSPAAGSVYRIDPRRPLDLQRLRVRLSVPADAESVTLYIDGEPFEIWASGPYETWWELEAGQHVFELAASLISGETIRTAPATVTVNAPGEAP